MGHSCSSESVDGRGASTVACTRVLDGARIKDTTPAMAGAAGTLTGDLAAITVKIWAGTSAVGGVAQALAATAVAARDKVHRASPAGSVLTGQGARGVRARPAGPGGW